jgi:hypothetical protein
LFQQSKPRPHDFACVAILAGFDLPYDKGVVFGS